MIKTVYLFYMLFFFSVLQAKSRKDSLLNAFDKAEKNSEIIKNGAFILDEIDSYQDPYYPIVYRKLFSTIKKTPIEKEEYNHIRDCIYHQTRFGAYEDAEELVNWSIRNIRNIEKVNYLARLYYAKARLFSYRGEREGIGEMYTDAIRKMSDPEPLFKAQMIMERGRTFYDMADYEIAMKDYVAALDIFEKEGIKNDLYVDLMHFIGSVFKRQNIDDKAMEYYEKMLATAQKNNNQYQEAEAYSLLADLYAFAGNKEKDRDYLLKALKIYRDLDYDMGIAQVQMNLAHGEIYAKKYDSAITRLEEVEYLSKKSNVKDFDFTINRYLGRIYALNGDEVQSKVHFDKALEIAENSDVKRMLNLSDLYRNIAFVNYDKGNYKQAFENLDLYLLYKDTLMSQENKEIINELEQKYESEKKESEITALNKDKVIKAKELESKNTTIKAFIAGIILVAILTITILYSLVVNRKKNKIITIQKQEVEDRNKEIMDSITYAKRIQNAILPPPKLVKEYLADSFILYKPKDIVAGDFYWMEPQKDGVIFAAADCTGHGVPGAMVSVVCNNGLNRSVREFGLTDPGKILDKTRDIVVEEFEKSDDDVKDGMDIALCALHSHSHSHSVLQYAGANSPLWIIRKGVEDIEEVKPDKQAIGKTDDPTPFTTHKIDLNKGDQIYIFSDGYQDQFGGDKNKKLKSKNFKKLLLSNRNESIQRQKELLDEAFDEWRGNYEQLDDICVIGVRV